MAYTTSHEQPTHPDRLRTFVLILTTMTTGMLAGIFVHWSNTVMRGLKGVDDRTFVESFRSLDDAINNPLFLGGFTCALLLIVLAAALSLGADQRAVLVWVGIALVLYLVACVITFGVHLPLNEEAHAGDGANGNVDYAAIRAQVDEATWTAWNTVRALAVTGTFGCLMWALVLVNRHSPTSSRPMNARQARPPM